MDVDKETETSIDEVFLFVDFGKRVRDDIFFNKVFFRIANLETENPLVQVNDLLFKGEYEDCVGSNLFFEDVEEPQPRRIFKPETSIHLKHKVTQFKVLSLKSVKIPVKLKDIPQPEYDVEINKDYTVETLMKKLALGSLNIEEDISIVPKDTVIPVKEIVTIPDDPKQIHSVKNVPMEESTNEQLQPHEELPMPSLVEREDSPEPEESVDILEYKYEKLRKLAKRPTRRKIEPEHVLQCDAKYQKSYEYNCIKSQIIKPSDYFPIISKEYNADNLVGAVDIDRSVLRGIIQPSPDYNRILSEDEKSELLSIQNLDNLSMLARYWVLKSQLEYLEYSVLSLSEEELLKKDIYNRTIGETVGIYKRLVRVLNGILEENYFYNSGEDTDDGEESGDEDLTKEADAEEDLLDISSENVQNVKIDAGSSNMESDSML
ncbi:hypothetical protein HHI36_012697 [Cryptolaemus montrouzieri]|uniref:Transcription factor TFIIIC triple barrel domain-containing protein n=1 Tax=Cryptolaemus montrouzieri TaxID=559131 RepID=A0ABD2NGE6_9CUCU